MQPPAKDKIAKVFVFCEQQLAIVLCAPNDLNIGIRWADLGHVDDLMSGAAQPSDQSGVHAFVNEPAHG